MKKLKEILLESAVSDQYQRKADKAATAFVKKWASTLSPSDNKNFRQELDAVLSATTDAVEAFTRDAVKNHGWK